MKHAPTPAEWVEACRLGDRRAVSRLISLLESRNSRTAEAAAMAVASLPRPAQTIGITGPPGAGKSTLLDYVVSLCRARGDKVAVLAIDPTSPFTGGAVLGDRIRMSTHAQDTDVFIRSMGSRGAAGGLAAAASDALRVLGGAGYNRVFLEAVGAGQTETEIVNLADTVCVVQVPGLGDDVQLMKMGMLEIADVFVVNKADKPESASLQQQILQALSDSTPPLSRVLRQLGPAFTAAYTGTPWEPPVLLLSGAERTGGGEWVRACDDHRAFLAQPSIAPALQRERISRDILRRAGRKFLEQQVLRLRPGGVLANLVDECAQGTLPLDQAIQRLLTF